MKDIKTLQASRQKLFVLAKRARKRGLPQEQWYAWVNEKHKAMCALIGEKELYHLTQFHW